MFYLPRSGLTLFVLAMLIGSLYGIACGSNLSQSKTAAPSTPTATSTKAPPTATATITPTPGPPQTIAVTVSDTGFTPMVINIRVGDTVTWTNNGPSIHWIVEDRSMRFNSGELSVGQTFSYTFQAADTFFYHCELYAYLKGEVVVQ